MAQTKNDFSRILKPRITDPEEIKQSMLKSFTNPIVEALCSTKKFYKENNKSTREQIKLSYPKTAHLEENDKRKIVFTGDSHLIYDKNSAAYVPHNNHNVKEIYQKKREGITLLL